MNKYAAHTILFLFDLLCLWGLWYGFSEIQLTLSKIADHQDVLRFSNRAGFFIVGLLLPIMHPVMIIEHYRPKLIKKFYNFLNRGGVVLLVVLLISGFVVSSWLESQAKNADYVHCWHASGNSAFAKTLVYTKDMKICEDLVETKGQGRK